MDRPQIPAREPERLARLRGLDVLDTPSDPVHDDLVRAAAALARTPIALVSLVDEDRQWFRARHGLDACETSRDVSLRAGMDDYVAKPMRRADLESALERWREARSAGPAAAQEGAPRGPRASAACPAP